MTAASRRCRLATTAGLLVVAAACGSGGGGSSTRPGLQHHDGGFFSVDAPIGWQVSTAGLCETFAFVLQDPQEPLRTIFYFGTIGPVYLTQAAKDIDEYACSFVSGPCPIPWVDAPVISPLTPAGFMSAWPDIAAMKAARDFTPAFPGLTDIKLASTVARPPMLPGATTGESRGLFVKDGRVGEGMFLVSVLPLMADLGNGHFACGVTAPKSELPARLDLYLASLDSFTVAQSYVQWCLDLAHAQWSAVAEAGRTLSEASDVLWDGWVARTHGEDILAEQYTDGFRGVDRVYDPASGTVYEVPAGWYADTYLPNRGSYDLGGLQPLPGDAWELWMKATTSGSQIH